MTFSLYNTVILNWGCRDTQGCRELEPGVPPINATSSSLFSFNHLGVPPNIHIMPLGWHKPKKVGNQCNWWTLFLYWSKLYNPKQVVQVLLPAFQSAGLRIDLDLLRRCIGIICVNAISFDLHLEADLARSSSEAGQRRRRRKGRILYPLASIVSHSCVNNAAYSIHPETLKQEQQQ